MAVRIAIISDIHANIGALKEVYKDARRITATTYWMLGDAIGYGPSPKDTLDYLRSKIKPSIWLAGNHDWAAARLEYAALGIPMTLGWGDDAKQSIQDHHRRLKPYEIANGYIKELGNLQFHCNPSEYPSVFLAHGAYYPNEVSKGILERYGSKRPQLLVFLEEDYQANRELWQSDTAPVISMYGHNHIARLVKRNPTGQWELISPLPTEAQPYQLEIGEIYHCNPGSVGFPREESAPCPSYMMLEISDDGVWSVWFRAVSYNSEVVRAELKGQHAHPDIYEKRLLRCERAR